ncbi:MAG TPA: ABC transporter permease [Stellaceae bacterium]|jgi:ABC-type spermidine/putrescine transport system permease subunit I|nr:ABC transporter permease [Stellaceae bacterium]
MSVAATTPDTLPFATARAPRDRTLLLLLPAIVMLVGMFIVPLVLFFIRSFTEFDGTTADFIDQAKDLLFSQAYLTALGTTNWIALIVTVIVLLIGYPIAYYLTTATGPGVSIVVLSIVLPYFTSIIVRTFSWMVLLGEHGLVNDVLLATGLVSAPLSLMYNRLGVLIGMSYVLLPYMVLTLYAAMRAIDPSLMRAASSLGASGFYTFWRVYFPLSLHGVLSGALIVYILSIGFFITPALMGGQHDIMIAMLIDRALEVAVDWPSAALMSLTLLVVTLVLYAIYYRVTDIRRLIGAR